MQNCGFILHCKLFKDLSNPAANCKNEHNSFAFKFEFKSKFKKETLILKYFLVLMDHVWYMYVVYIWKKSVLGDVSGVASFITTNEQLQ